ncbi:MAG: DUF5615 family PIN-like protein [Candidatus Schekmanbacteria bacterium]|nr:DUF5615 family PIN-like protein [Candidatus Schekmanbacteria bacterium]
MKFLADESVDGQIVARLRQDGHFLWYVAEMEPGISDETVLSLANNEKAILLTADKDFGELVFRQHRLTSGVVLIRLAGLPGNNKSEIVSSAVNNHSSELIQAFTVITVQATRIRRYFL